MGQINVQESSSFDFPTESVQLYYTVNPLSLLSFFWGILPLCGVGRLHLFLLQTPVSQHREESDSHN